MSNPSDNSKADAMKRSIDATKLKLGYCIHPHGYEPCPHYPGSSFAPRSRWDHLSDFRERDRPGGPGLYLGHRLNQLPLRYYHHLCCVTAQEDLDWYFRERLRQSVVAEALKAD
jgi:hypothetical protein